MHTLLFAITTPRITYLNQFTLFSRNYSGSESKDKCAYGCKSSQNEYNLNYIIDCSEISAQRHPTIIM